MRLFLVATPGLEAVLLDEARALEGAEELAPTAGGVELEGKQRLLWRANLELRTATRVLVRAGEVRARDFARLRREAAALPWERFIAAGAVPEVRVRASAKKCRLYHTGGIAERVAGAVEDRFGKPSPPGPAAPPALDVLVRGEHDDFTVSVDASGEPLYKRGHRVFTAKASLRETLAAGLLALAGWDPSREALADPMCGAGTIPLEAALRALGRAPGAGRGFAFEAWPGHDAAGYRALLDTLAARGREPGAAPPRPILASDLDPAAADLARRNLESAGLASLVPVAVASAEQLQLPPGPGLIIANPPYGKRISSAPPIAALLALARRSPGWRLAILAPPEAFPPSPRPATVHRLENGGLRVQLALFPQLV